MARLSRWLINLAVIYALLVGGMLLARRSLIYPFDQTVAWTGDIPDLLIKDVERPDGTTLVVWAAEPEFKRPVLYYFMGNVGNLGYSEAWFREFRALGYGIVAMGYQGGGGADGKPSENALKGDAQYIWDNMEKVLRIRVPQEDRYILGQSLGAGIAADLASKNENAGTVLITPFTRLCEVAEHQIKIVPVCRLMWDEHYRIDTQLPEISAPVLILHGTDDATIPFEMSERLVETSPNATLKVYEGGTHNDLRLFGAVRDIDAFISGLRAN